jgi:hypothetical protein
MEMPEAMTDTSAEVEEFSLDLDDVCTIASMMATGIEYTGKLVMLAQMTEPEFDHPDHDEWVDMMAEAEAHKARCFKAAERLAAIHNAQHEGKRVTVLVIPF